MSKVYTQPYAERVTASLLSTNSDVVIDAVTIDARNMRTVCFTIAIDATNAVTWTVEAGNQYDATTKVMADAVQVQAPASVAASAASKFTDTAAAYGFYRVKIKATAGGSQGTATVYGNAKG